jgi:hypothetical protein
MTDRTAQTEHLTTGQQIVAKWEGLNGWSEPADLAEGIDDAIAAARSAALEEAAKVADKAGYKYRDDNALGDREEAYLDATIDIAAAIRELKDKSSTVAEK